MIRLWLARGSAVSAQEQLRAQLVLGILSGRLAPGERLPSVRELARRLHLHPNTISAVYQHLFDGGWVDRRHGSGVFVRRSGEWANDGSVDMLVRSFVEGAQARGVSIDALQEAFARVAKELKKPRFLVIDSELEFARLMAAEIGEAIGLEIPSGDFAELSQAHQAGRSVLATEASAPHIRSSVQDANLRPIRLKSMQEVLFGHQRPSPDVLIAVASRSQAVLRWAATLLSALGFDTDSVLLRDAKEPNWQEGLGACDLVAVDVVTARELSAVANPIIFRVVSEEFLGQFQGLMRPSSRSSEDKRSTLPR